MRFDTPASIPLGRTSRQRQCYVFPHPPGLIRVKNEEASTALSMEPLHGERACIRGPECVLLEVLK